MPADRRKIVVTTHFGWGMHRYRMDLLRSLMAAGYDVTAIADWSDGDYEGARPAPRACPRSPSR